MDILQKAFQYLKKKKNVSFATSVNNEPNIRVFEVMDVIDERIYFSTAPHKMVWQQLLKNPVAEILAFDHDISVRVRGNIKSLTDENLCKKLYDIEENSIFRELYPNFLDLTYFCLEPKILTYFDLRKRPPLIESYTCVNGKLKMEYKLKS